ncbi:hypothetical protein EAF00_012028 [Botryotinia globosa]|nr:hypothetical protein EAF00_012028 [Botryotinia globosa]
MDNLEALSFSESPENYLANKFASSSSTPSASQEEPTFYNNKKYRSLFIRLLVSISVIFSILLFMSGSISLFGFAHHPSQPICREKSLLELPSINALRSTSSHLQSLCLEPPTPILRSQMRNLSSSFDTLTLNSHLWIEHTVDSLEGLLPVIDAYEAMRQREGSIRSWLDGKTNEESSTQNQLITIRETIHELVNSNSDIIDDFMTLYGDLNRITDSLLSHNIELVKQLHHENGKWFWRTDQDKVKRLEAENHHTHGIWQVCGGIKEVVGEANVFARLGGILKHLGKTAEAEGGLVIEGNNYSNSNAMRELVGRFRAQAVSSTSLLKSKMKNVDDKIRELKELGGDGRDGMNKASDGVDGHGQRGGSKNSGVGDAASDGFGSVGSTSRDQAEKTSTRRRWWQWGSSDGDEQKARRGGGRSEWDDTRQGRKQQNGWLSPLFNLGANVGGEVVQNWMVHNLSENVMLGLDYVVTLVGKLMKVWVSKKVAGLGFDFGEKGGGNAAGNAGN